MSTPTNLMAYGFPPLAAERLGVQPVITSAGGSSAGSALSMAGNQFLTFITASNSGSGLKLPQIGGDIGANAGAALGDEIRIMNGLSAAIQIYCANNANGSAVTLFINAVSAAGTTGISLATGQMAIFWPVTASTYVGIKSSV